MLLIHRCLIMTSMAHLLVGAIGLFLFLVSLGIRATGGPSFLGFFTPIVAWGFAIFLAMVIVDVPLIFIDSTVRRDWGEAFFGKRKK